MPVAFELHYSVVLSEHRKMYFFLDFVYSFLLWVIISHAGTTKTNVMLLSKSFCKWHHSTVFMRVYTLLCNDLTLVI